MATNKDFDCNEFKSADQERKKKPGQASKITRSATKLIA